MLRQSSLREMILLAGFFSGAALHITLGQPPATFLFGSILVASLAAVAAIDRDEARRFLFAEKTAKRPDPAGRPDLWDRDLDSGSPT